MGLQGSARLRFFQAHVLPSRGDHRGEQVTRFPGRCGADSGVCSYCSAEGLVGNSGGEDASCTNGLGNLNRWVYHCPLSAGKRHPRRVSEARRFIVYRQVSRFVVGVGGKTGGRSKQPTALILPGAHKGVQVNGIYLQIDAGERGINRGKRILGRRTLHLCRHEHPLSGIERMDLMRVMYGSSARVLNWSTMIRLVRRWQLVEGSGAGQAQTRCIYRRNLHESSARICSGVAPGGRRLLDRWTDRGTGRLLTRSPHYCSGMLCGGQERAAA
jgi:hypothetical protein